MILVVLAALMLALLAGDLFADLAIGALVLGFFVAFLAGEFGAAAVATVGLVFVLLRPKRTA